MLTSAAPMLSFVARVGLAITLIWLGLAKCVPGWNPAQSDSEHLVSLLTAAKVDATIGLIILGVLQIAAGLCLLMRCSAIAAAMLLTLLLAIGITLVVMHLTHLVDANGWTPNQQGISLLKGLALHLTGLAFAAQAAAPRR